jgi:hypothetical protein
MAAQKRYPDELRERAVKMVFEVRDGTGRGTGKSPGLPGSWMFTRRRCVPGCSRRKLTGEIVPARRRMISGGSLNWNARCASSGGLMRS